MAGSVEARVSMFYDTLSAAGADCAVAGGGDGRHVLDVEVLETPAVFRDTLHSSVTDQGTALHAKLLQVGTVL